jgi:hypothetical protein
VAIIKVILSETNEMTNVKGARGEVQCYVWRGQTESGIPVEFFVAQRGITDKNFRRQYENEIAIEASKLNRAYRYVHQAEKRLVQTDESLQSRPEEAGNQPYWTC